MKTVLLVLGGCGVVVVLIIGALGVFVAPKVMNALDDARWGKVHADLAALDSAVTQYQENNGEAPAALALLVLSNDRDSTRYLNRESVPKDPWGKPYVYIAPVGERPHEIWCYGADGARGGEGDARDLSARMVRDGEL